MNVIAGWYVAVTWLKPSVVLSGRAVEKVSLGSRTCSCTHLKFFCVLFLRKRWSTQKNSWWDTVVRYRVQLKHSRALCMWYAPQQAFFMLESTQAQNRCGLSVFILKKDLLEGDVNRNYTLCTGLVKSKGNLWVVSTKMFWKLPNFFFFFLFWL